MSIKSKNLKELIFLFTVALLSLGVLYVFLPYLGVILIAFILVEFFYPWYEFLLRHLKSEMIASLIAGISVLLTVIIPLLLVSTAIVFQTKSMIDTNKDFWTKDTITSTYKSSLKRTNNFISNFSENEDHQITNEEVEAKTIEISEKSLNVVVNVFTKSIEGVVKFIAKTFMLIICIFAFFSLKPKIGTTLRQLNPLDRELGELFIRDFVQTIKSIIKGTFGVAVLIGFIGGTTLWLLGVEAPIFWGLMMTLFSLIPIGSGIIWLPLSIYLALTGDILQAAILFSIGMLMSNVIDTLARGYIAQEGTKLHPLVLAFSILGGLEVFGLLGFLYGPIIIVFFLSAMRVYHEKYQ